MAIFGTAKKQADVHYCTVLYYMQVRVVVVGGVAAWKRTSFIVMYVLIITPDYIGFDPAFYFMGVLILVSVWFVFHYFARRGHGYVLYRCMHVWNE